VLAGILAEQTAMWKAAGAAADKSRGIFPAAPRCAGPLHIMLAAPALGRFDLLLDIRSKLGLSNACEH